MNLRLIIISVTHICVFFSNFPYGTWHPQKTNGTRVSNTWTPWCSASSWKSLRCVVHRVVGFQRLERRVQCCWFLALKKPMIPMGVSKNRGSPKSWILIGFSIINHPFWGTPIFGNTHIDDWNMWMYKTCVFFGDQYLLRALIWKCTHNMLMRWSKMPFNVLYLCEISRFPWLRSTENTCSAKRP